MVGLEETLFLKSHLIVLPPTKPARSGLQSACEPFIIVNRRWMTRCHRVKAALAGALFNRGFVLRRLRLLPVIPHVQTAPE